MLIKKLGNVDLPDIAHVSIKVRIFLVVTIVTSLQ